VGRWRRGLGLLVERRVKLRRMVLIRLSIERRFGMLMLYV
jgi:hypothetical protein